MPQRCRTTIAGSVRPESPQRSVRPSSRVHPYRRRNSGKSGTEFRIRRNDKPVFSCGNAGSFRSAADWSDAIAGGMLCQRYGKRIAGRNFLPADRKTPIPGTNNRPPTGADRADVSSAALSRSACRRRSPATADVRIGPLSSAIRHEPRAQPPVLSPHPNDKHLNDRI